MLTVSRSVTTYHHGSLRPALVEAAIELLGEVPPGRLSLREVARRAGVSHNAPYHHFADRAELLGAVGVQAMNDLVEAQERAVGNEDEPVARLRAMSAAYVGYAADHPQAFALIFDPEYCAAGSPSADMAPLIERNEQLLAREVDSLVAQPSFAGRDPQLLAAGIWAAVHGMSQLVVLGHLPREVAGPAVHALLTD